DCKLCVSPTLLNLDRSQGRFITVVPRTRGEVEDFQHKVEASLVRWEKVMAKRSSRKQGRIDLYEVASGLYQLQEGFRLYWFRSSEKARRDWDEREEKIASAMDQLRALADPVRKRKPKKEQTLRKQAEAILARFAVRGWIKVDIASVEVEKFRQVTRGRSSADTMYRKLVHWVPRINCSRDENAIARAELMDGTFPLTTNTELDAAALLRAYKYQPNLEKRQPGAGFFGTAQPDSRASPQSPFHIAQRLCLKQRISENSPVSTAECRQYLLTRPICQGYVRPARLVAEPTGCIIPRVFGPRL